ncbi:MAG TPA: DUF2865 domain-containing protein, partial [Hyphomicrobiaceae bacterium]|nr:DUF2865 domain-containing protein [Hyphomicrobiaceae bacterium]
AGQSQICFQLEQRLIAEGQRGKSSVEVRQKLELEMRQLERQLQTANASLERSQCYEFWLFNKTLRRTPECVALFNQGEYAKRRLMELDAQRQQILGLGERSMQDELIRELARNNCGSTYTAEAAKRGGTGPFAGWWQDEDAGPSARGGNFGALPYATYRTLCVRLCDGYYFPVSFATLRNHFDKDQDICQSRCAAPVELYYYQNPGGSVEQMVSHRTQLPYNTLRSAFKYRKEVVTGCSCRKEEYVPSTADRGDRKGDPAATAPVPAKGVPR